MAAETESFVSFPFAMLMMVGTALDLLIDNKFTVLTKKCEKEKSVEATNVNAGQNYEMLGYVVPYNLAIHKFLDLGNEPKSLGHGLDL